MRQILYVWNYREWGGAQIYFMSLMKETKKSYAVTAMIPSGSESRIVDYLDSLDVPIEYVPVADLQKKRGRLGTKLAIFMAERLLVDRILTRKGLSNTIVHIDLGFWQSFIALFRLCRKTNVFMTVHTALQAYKGWRRVRWAIKGKILSRFASFHLLASNREAKESLRPYVSVDKFHQVEVTYSGIDPDEIIDVSKSLPAKSDIKARYSLPQDKFLLMTVGQFIERKGCWILLECLRQMKETGEGFTFVWLSTTLPDSETLKRIEAFGLGDSFRLMSAEEIGETRADLLTLLSDSDVFVLASLQEGLPIALIEAMALGLPCIASRVNAIPEAIEDGGSGVFVPPGNANALREAITSLLGDAGKRKRLGAAAKVAAFEKFNSRTSAERTAKLYDEVWQSTR